MRSANALLGILSGIMLLCAGGAWWFWRHGSAFECVDRVVEEVPSPDGRYVAARWERDCAGAVATHVTLRARQAAFSSSDAEDVYVAKGREQVVLRWSRAGSIELSVSTPSVVPGTARWRDVSVSLVPPH